MSVERRLAAKERARKARRRAAAKKAAAILFIPVLALVIVAIVLIVKKINKLDYSKYLSEDGKIEGRAVSEYFNYFPNLDEFKVDITEVTDEDVKKEIISKIKKVEGAPETAETTEDSKSDDEYYAMFTDQWVEENLADTLGEDYNHTTSGYEKYVRGLLESYNKLLAQYNMPTRLSEAVQVKESPKKLMNNLRKLMLHDYADYRSQYASEEEFQTAIDDEVETFTRNLLIWLKVYEDLGLTATESDYVAWYAKNNEKEDASDEEKQTLWDNACKENGRAWWIVQYRAETAQSKLSEKMFGAETTAEE
ncbi:MAG: hypothetical protein J5845_00325 [Lachnospiraceae bacterium]|nr:hypothetical protein [Lachnospiraceae bacterium]